ncbi:antitoxin [Acinetobacter sp. WCHAc060025]|uniref:type II toxin-antitoxin system RelB family antitoxin n=1 Tax=Acinetobacter sp. WCHAc060025 TaxID=2518625 RepID=UPI00102320B4|nr:antitoxin [Acinetobacter sp. WCHAc060025]RZG77090.1 antitoxin [Acinetobacter sp. WCHAc060025]
MNEVFDPFVSEFDDADMEQNYNEWLKNKVEQSIVDSRPSISHDQVIERMKQKREERLKNLDR